jgi:transmembrane sensor
MDELTSALSEARRTIDPGWDHGRAKKARETFHVRQRNRRRTRIAAAVAVPVLALVVVLGVRLRVGETPGPGPRVVATHATEPASTLRTAADGPWRFWDGSVATPVDGTARLRAAEVSPSRIVVDVERGAGRFEVTPGRGDREFVVRSNAVTVRVIGTVFSVGAEGARTRVAVEHGRVSVEWPGGQAFLAEGESGVYPPATGTAAPALEAPAPSTPPAPSPARNWRRLAESGEFGEAFEALATAEVRDRPEELLLAADAARLSSHPREALTYYQRVVRDHAGDPRAPLAAFTMGRVLLTQLGRPRDAASAFARARSLAGGGSLAEDALAREVEARSLAGETERARSLAEEYVARYPSGQRIRAVRRFGGLP